MKGFYFYGNRANAINWLILRSRSNLFAINLIEEALKKRSIFVMKNPRAEDNFADKQTRPNEIK
jgi:hypothetical protein